MDSRLAKTNRCLLASLAFLVVLAISPYSPNSAVDIKILIYELFAFAALALWLFTPRCARGEARRSSALLPLFIAYLVFNLAAAFYSGNMGYSLSREFIKTAALFILFLAAADAYQTPKQVWTLISVICVAVSIAAVYGLAQHMGSDPFPWIDPTNMLHDAPATFGNPNLASHVFMPTIILAVGLSIQRKGRWAILCIPLLLGLLTLAKTRGSLIALVGAAALVLVVTIVSRRVKKLSHVIVLTFAALLVTAMVGIATVATITKLNTGQIYPQDESLVFRFNSFYGACRMIQDRPWVGHGPGMYRVHSPEYWTTLEKTVFTDLNRRNAYVHNEPLEIATEAGLPAAIAYITILVIGIYYGLSLGLRPRNSGHRSFGLTMAAFFLAFLVDGFAGFNLHAPVSAVLLFLIAGTMAGVWREREAPTVRCAFRYEWFPIARRLFVLGCALIIPVLGIREFSAQLFHQRGLGALKFEAHAEATESFAKAASLAPYDWIHPYFLGITAKGMGRLDDEARYFGRTIELHPNFIHARTRKAQALINQATSSSDEEALAFLEEAVSEVEQVIRIAPQLPEAHELFGRALLLQANWQTGSSPDETIERKNEVRQKAEGYLLKAIEYGSDEKEALYLLLAKIGLARHDVYAAQDALVHALESNPESEESWMLLLTTGSRLLDSSQGSSGYDAIIDSLEWCIERLSNTQDKLEAAVALSLLRADILHTVYRDDSGAEKAFQEIVLAHPARIEAWAQYHLFAQANDREEAVNGIFIQAVARQENADETLPELIQAVAVGLQKDKNGIVEGVSRLVSALQRDHTLDPNPARVAADYSWAVDLLAARAQQTSMRPEDARAVYVQLSLMYEVFQDFETAVQMLDRALSIEADEAWRDSVQQKIDTMQQKLKAQQD